MKLDQVRSREGALRSGPQPQLVCREWHSDQSGHADSPNSYRRTSRKGKTGPRPPSTEVDISLVFSSKFTYREKRGFTQFLNVQISKSFRLCPVRKKLTKLPLFHRDFLNRVTLIHQLWRRAETHTDKSRDRPHL